ncbi:MAG: hypothetical protein AVDCRST_MAG41-532 [uncultured Corynebacteriales bacterium]|uniref:Uncharacterized protein n=1 Tax=uncultured Mycobacteriales bacterium TaxID=581187 RepID=A0A6J4HDU8_9ACTN|nr:MAG: hypothetical protein AVDCRST_MAG41-532 [uncultured Corynebacteriales bacterium]
MQRAAQADQPGPERGVGNGTDHPVQDVGQRGTVGGEPVVERLDLGQLPGGGGGPQPGEHAGRHPGHPEDRWRHLGTDPRPGDRVARRSLPVDRTQVSADRRHSPSRCRVRGGGRRSDQRSLDGAEHRAAAAGARAAARADAGRDDLAPGGQRLHRVALRGQLDHVHRQVVQVQSQRLGVHGDLLRTTMQTGMP